MSGNLEIKTFYGKDSLGEFSIKDIAGSLTAEQFSEMLDDFLNIGGKQFSTGKIVGEALRSHHRTIQRSSIAFSLGVIVGISDQKYTDLRNGQAIDTAKNIAQMWDDGQLNIGGYV